MNIRQAAKAARTARPETLHRIGRAVLLGWTIGPVIAPPSDTARGHLYYKPPQDRHEYEITSVYTHWGPDWLEAALDEAGVP